MTVAELFIKLTEYLIPYEEEKRLEPLLPKGVQKDEVGNYYIIIGDTKTMFTSHLDNYTTKLVKVNHVLFEDDKGRKKVKTDEKTPLGSDDKAGVTIMIKMIENNVPGCYYFFIGEEPAGFGGGCKGSNEIYKRNKEWFKKFDRCIAFDRKGYGSIISRQRGKDCCSKEFVSALAAEFASQDLSFKDDTTGRYTDSAVFMYTIPEVTNLSCGGFNEHTPREFQNLDYLERMVDACTKINWEKLPVVREAKEPSPYYYWEKKPTTTKKETGFVKKEIPKEETPLTKKRRSEEQKRKPDFGFLNYKSWTKKRGKDLFDTIRDYMEYFGYRIHSYEDRIIGSTYDAKLVGKCKLSVPYFIEDQVSSILRIVYNNEKTLTFIVYDTDITLRYHINKKNEVSRTYYSLKELEKDLGVGFAAKFYKYVDDFMKDLIDYSKMERKWIILREDVDVILKQYGKFNFNDLKANYDKLFDADDFTLGDYFLKLT